MLVSISNTDKLIIMAERLIHTVGRNMVCRTECSKKMELGVCGGGRGRLVGEGD